MKTTKYVNRFLLAAAACCGFAFTSCSDEIPTSFKFDEGIYDGLSRIDGMLVDEYNSANERTLTLTDDAMTTAVRFMLTCEPGKGVDAVVSYDGDYLQNYNLEHGTEYELFPESAVELEGEGRMLLAPDDKRSAALGVTLRAFEGFSSEKEYLLPLIVRVETEGITVPESSAHVVYLVKDGRTSLSADKGPDAVKNIVFFELGDANPLNALEFRLQESGKLFFDYVVLFSGNINYDPAENRVYFSRNKEVQFLLDNNEEYLQPLRKCGIKVIMGVLGNHDDSGLAQLSDPAARDFAAELAAYCETYGLDGVCFDDEYSNVNPDTSNPLFTRPSMAAAARLLYETKKAMPHKTVMVYYLGNITPYIPAVDGVDPGYFVDVAVADYSTINPGATPMTGMPLKNCAGASIEMNLLKGDWKTETARKQKAAGYGHYMFFSLNPDNYAWRGQVTMVRSVASGLYDETLDQVTHYYKKEDTERLELSRPQ